MSYESPTLKVRLELAESMAGMDCYVVAKRLIGRGEGVKVLDAKWGREPTKWRETGGGWGRNTPKLTDSDDAMLAAILRRFISDPERHEADDPFVWVDGLDLVLDGRIGLSAAEVDLLERLGD